MNPSRSYRNMDNLKKITHKVTPQNQFMVFVLNKIASHSMSTVFDKIKQLQNKNLHKIKNVERVYQRFLKTIFFSILQRALNTEKVQAVKKKNQIMSINIVNKYHRTNVQRGFKKLKFHEKNSPLKNKAATVILNRLSQMYARKQIKAGFEQVHRCSVKVNKKRESIEKISLRFLEVQNKKVKQCFEILLKEIFHRNYSHFFKISEKRRKRVSTMDNEKKTRVSVEINNLHKFKNQLDSALKNENLSAFKKEASLKVIHTKQNIKNDGKLLQQRKVENEILKKNISSFISMHENRIILKQESKKDRGAYEKVLRLHQDLQLEDESVDKLKMLKEKFKNHLKNGTLKNFSEFYMRKNILNNKLICQYEKTPVEILHISKQYLRVNEQNKILKEFIELLVEIQLKKSGDKELNSSFHMLQKHIDSLFGEEESSQSVLRSPKAKMRASTRGSFSSVDK